MKGFAWDGTRFPGGSSASVGEVRPYAPQLYAGDADDGVLITLQRFRRACPSAPHARVNHAGWQDLQGVKEASELRGRMVIHRCHGRGVAGEAFVRALGVDMDRGEHQEASRR